MRARRIVVLGMDAIVFFVVLVADGGLSAGELMLVEAEGSDDALDECLECGPVGASSDSERGKWVDCRRKRKSDNCPGNESVDELTKPKPALASPSWCWWFVGSGRA